MIDLCVSKFKDGDLWVPVEVKSIPDDLRAAHPEWFDRVSYLTPSMGCEWSIATCSINLSAYMKHVAGEPLQRLLQEFRDAEAYSSRPIFGNKPASADDFNVVTHAHP